MNAMMNALELKFLAQHVRNNRQFRSIIRAAKPELREGVYNMISQHLKFKPLKFRRLVGNDA